MVCTNRLSARGVRAFTLIEVLVVVTIIALLVSVLLPSLAKARDQARRTVCAANQKQIANALNMYTTSYKGELPHSVPAFNASLTWIVWQEFAKAPYPPKGWVHLGLLYGGRQIREPKVFYCPSYREYPHVYPEGWTGYSAGSKGFEKVATSYTYALNGQVNAYKPGVRITARLEKLRVSEALYSCVFNGKVDKRQQKGVWPHRGGVNAGYADGSVQLARVEESLARVAADLYVQNDIGSMDYFAFCFFRMLSGERRWMNAWPNVLAK